MHFEPHATLGWAIGNLGGADRRLRNYCVLGAVLPDIDAIPFVISAELYGALHHTFGHNVFLWAIFAGWVTWKCRSWRALLLSALSFGAHLLTDAQWSGWDLYLFWPLSPRGYLFRGAVGLEAPINYWLVYLCAPVILLLAWLHQRTPLDIFSPKLDQIVLAFFRAKPFACGVCGKSCNQHCEVCHMPVCVRHGNLQRGMRLLCPACAPGARHKRL